MTLKIWGTEDMPSPNGGHICAIVVAESEEDARFLFEQSLIKEDVPTTDRFGIPFDYTMTPVKLWKRQAMILSYGDEH